MVWIPLLRELGAKYNVYDYSWDNITDGPSFCDPRMMDPIPEGLAGCLNRTALLTAAESLQCPILKQGTKVLESEATFVHATQPGSIPPTRCFKSNTRAMFLGCLWLMFSWNLLTPATHEEILAFAVFFTVPKSNGRLRTIMDCRDLNQRSMRPPPVNLAGMGDSLRKAAELGCKVHIQADICHWFHLFKLPPGVPKWFGLSCESKEEGRTDYFHCATMCMGWSWAHS